MFYDLEKIILFLIIYIVIYGGVLVIRGVLFVLFVVIVVVVFGVVFIGLLNMGFINNFNIVCEKVVDVRIKKLIKIYLKEKMRVKFEIVMKNNVNKVLEIMNVEINEFIEE